MKRSEKLPVVGTHRTTGQTLEYPSLHAAERHGFTRAHISRCCFGQYRYRSHKGFTWTFKNPS